MNALERYRKLEELAARSPYDGEREAARAAMKRIEARLETKNPTPRITIVWEFKCVSIRPEDIWSRVTIT